MELWKRHIKALLSVLYAESRRKEEAMFIGIVGSVRQIQGESRVGVIIKNRKKVIQKRYLKTEGL